MAVRPAAAGPRPSRAHPSVAASVPPPAAHEEGQRNALRAAIAQALPATTTQNGGNDGRSTPVRSPADILRDRKEAKPSLASPSHKASDEHGKAMEGKQNPQHHPNPQPRPAIARDTVQNGSNGEVSPEMLEGVLRGEDSEE